jgi:hypothetical protein
MKQPKKKNKSDFSMPPLLPGMPWLEKEEVPDWLQAMFQGKEYKDRMQALKMINAESVNIDVSLN